MIKADTKDNKEAKVIDTSRIIDNLFGSNLDERLAIMAQTEDDNRREQYVVWCW